MDEKMTLRARAKINWVLSVEGRRADGYHELSMLMQPLSLHDEVTVRTANGVAVDCAGVSGGNIAEVAARAFMRRFGSGGAHIAITKRIPQQAGLGGGSADAAAVLRAMAALYGVRDEAALFEVAREVGADVPFCLLGRAALVGGIGEELTEVAAVRVPVVLAQPQGGVSTAQAFAEADLLGCARYDPRPAQEALARGDLAALGGALGNSLLDAAQRINPGIGGVLEQLRRSGALGVSMSGSGACCFGVYADAAQAKLAAQQIAAPFVWSGEAICDGTA